MPVSPHHGQGVPYGAQQQDKASHASASPGKNPRTPDVGRMRTVAHQKAQQANKHPPAVVHTPEKFVGIDLSRMKLRALSPSIAIYSFLSELYLQFNNLSVLPVEMFSALTGLRVLGMLYSHFPRYSPVLSRNDGVDISTFDCFRDLIFLNFDEYRV
jgi:hypothetical protein